MCLVIDSTKHKKFFGFYLPKIAKEDIPVYKELHHHNGWIETPSQKYPVLFHKKKAVLKSIFTQDGGDIHTKIVNMVIQFCKEHNLTNVDEFYISADGIMGSIKFGEWCPCTDSSMSIIEVKKDKKGYAFPDREIPFLYEI